MNKELHASILLTQDSLGSFVKLPRMTYKLLERPPVKFMYDIIMEVMRLTDFGKSEFTAVDCAPTVITTKEGKLSFFGKLIRLIAASCPDLKIEANPATIVAGLEPEKTNTLLYQLYVASAQNMPPQWQLSLGLNRLEFLTPKLFEVFEEDSRKLY